MHWERLWYQRGSWVVTEAFIVICGHCRAHAYWLGKELIPTKADFASGVMIHPSLYATPLPHPEMPSEIRTDYDEAREIAGHSPRAAAALLRLCVQKLCNHLGQPGKNINDDIGALVKNGLPVEIQQALDIVRVVGNNAVHPAEISQDDVAEVSGTLFELVNYIVEDRISRPAKLAAMFSALPAPALAGIAKRDKNYP
jgi:Domain of unknown function (DUF4145)